MRIGATTAFAALLAAALAAAAAAPGGELAPRTIDRTLVCSTQSDADGGRAVGIGAAPRSQYNKAMLGVFSYGRTEDDNRPLVHVFAPGPGPPIGGAQGNASRHGMWIDTSVCRTVAPRFAVSRAGLPGVLTQTFAEARCAVGRTVLVRVRVAFAPWRGWRRLQARAGPPRLPAIDVARGRPTTASVAVRAFGRPVAYAMFDRSGQTRLVSAGRPRCEG